MHSDKKWYIYNDTDTGEKCNSLPIGLPHIYSILYQQVDELESQHVRTYEIEGSNTAEWEYVRRVLEKADFAPEMCRNQSGW
jgi:hypothetical protein